MFYVGDIHMKEVKVVAAIIVNDKKQIFVTQRGYGAFKDGWEFPGGKIEAGETPEEALIREIKEELDADINVDHYLCNVEHDYETFHLSMKCFICSLKNKHVVLLEHEAAKFVNKNDLDSVAFLPADIKIIKELQTYLESSEIVK